jgi:signal transduction histidine kinase
MLSDGTRIVGGFASAHGPELRSDAGRRVQRHSDSSLGRNGQLRPWVDSRTESAQYSRRVTSESRQLPDRADEVLHLVPLFALAVSVLALVVDPSSTVGLVFAAVPVAAFALWAVVPRMPLHVLVVAVLVPVVVGQRGGELEPLFFQVSLLAFVIGRTSKSLATAIVLGVVAAGSPVLVSVIQDPSEISVGIWILGIAFPWAIGAALAHQAQLSAQLDATRRELAHQALLSERRRIARDVHDFVGHGLAAMMLQVTSARHVLRRDPAAAEEALRSAEEVGRRSMSELRRTVSLLRSDTETMEVAPLPSAADIPALVEAARTGGLAVELRTHGDLSRMSPGVGLALYRIAQEALANATRHAPASHTVLGVELAGKEVRLVADTNGPLHSVRTADLARPQYGLIGMRERATALGGEFTAGPTPEGWRVTCCLPLIAGDRPGIEAEIP